MTASAMTPSTDLTADSQSPRPLDAWRGRVDPLDGQAGWRWHQVVRGWDGAMPDSAALHAGPRPVALLGLASDEGVRRNQGRQGAASGPAQLRSFLSNLPVQEDMNLLDAGDISCQGHDLETAQARYAQQMSTLIDQGHLPIGLGGGHEIGWASYLGWAQSRCVTQAPQAKLGLLNLDAHFDLRTAQHPTSGTPFLQALEHAKAHGLDLSYACWGASESANTRVLFERAEQWGVNTRLDTELGVQALPARLAELQAWLDGVDQVYLTICLDVLPAGVAPGVSAPSARGVPQEVVEALVDTVLRSGKLVLADVAEYAPAFDQDGHTGRVAARLVHRIARQGAAR